MYLLIPCLISITTLITTTVVIVAFVVIRIDCSGSDFVMSRRKRDEIVCRRRKRAVKCSDNFPYSIPSGWISTGCDEHACSVKCFRILSKKDWKTSL